LIAAYVVLRANCTTFPIHELTEMCCWLNFKSCGWMQVVLVWAKLLPWWLLIQVLLVSSHALAPGSWASEGRKPGFEI